MTEIQVFQKEMLAFLEDTSLDFSSAIGTLIDEYLRGEMTREDGAHEELVRGIMAEWREYCKNSPEKN